MGMKFPKTSYILRCTNPQIARLAALHGNKYGGWLKLPDNAFDLPLIILRVSNFSPYDSSNNYFGYSTDGGCYEDNEINYGLTIEVDFETFTNAIPLMVAQI